MVSWVPKDPATLILPLVFMDSTILDKVFHYCPLAAVPCAMPLPDLLQEFST